MKAAKAKVVGSIGPRRKSEVTQGPDFDGPSSILYVRDGRGRLHGRIEWLRSEAEKPSFDDALVPFCAATVGPWDDGES